MGIFRYMTKYKSKHNSLLRLSYQSKNTGLKLNRNN